MTTPIDGSPTAAVKAFAEALAAEIGKLRHQRWAGNMEADMACGRVIREIAAAVRKAMP